MVTLDLVFQDDFIKNDERKGQRRRQTKPVLIETLSFLQASICDTCYVDFYPPNIFFFFFLYRNTEIRHTNNLYSV
jgi:hypothetical protein